MVNKRTVSAERTLLLLYAQCPPRLSAVNPRPAPRRAHRRRRRRVQGSTGDRSTGESNSSDCSRDSEGDEDESSLDGVYGVGGVGLAGLSERRRWQDSADHEWGRNEWVEQVRVPEGAATWVKDMKRSGRDALASGSTSVGAPLNTKWAHAVNLVRQRDLQPQAHHHQRDTPGEEQPAKSLSLSESLRMLITRTTGTRTTAVINEIVRSTGPETFKLLAASGNAAGDIGGEVRFTSKCSTVSSSSSTGPCSCRTK